MKSFLCLWTFVAVANAGLLGHKQGFINGPHVQGGSGNIYRVKVINEGHGGGYGPAYGRPPAPQVIRLIHQDASASQALPSIPAPSAPAKVIRVIHQHAEPIAASARIPSVGPVSAPAQVIKVIHEHRSGGPLVPSGTAIQQQISAPAKVIRVIHELAPAQTSFPAPSFPSAAVTAPDNNYLPPVQTPAQNFNPPAQQYGAPSYQNAVSTQYLPPLPQYSAPSATFTAPEPVPSATHLPAQSYGPPTH